MCQPYRCEVDREIFDSRFLDRGLITRFGVNGFNVTIRPKNHPSSPIINGPVSVVVAVYFNATISVTYRMVVSQDSGSGHSTQELDSDDLILLAGIPLGTEHWTRSEERRDYGRINSEVDLLVAQDLFLDEEGVPLTQPTTIRGSGALRKTFSSYRNFLTGGLRHSSTELYGTNYVLIDVWEDISHAGGRFRGCSAPDIIRHIEEHHKTELMGLLTLYPYEWEFRDPRFFRRVAGDNIAIDTDDLVLIGENVTLVIGTYGLRGEGEPTNWKAVLKDRAVDNVSWPELLHIEDIALAKMHTMRTAFFRLQLSDLVLTKNLRAKDLIKANSLLSLEVSRMLIDLDAIDFSRYSSHKLMYRLIEDRLGIEKEFTSLVNALSQVEKAVTNIDSVDELKRSRMIRMLLAFITVASIFQVIFENTTIPVVEKLVSQTLAEKVGTVVIVGVAVGLVAIVGIGIVSLFWQWTILGIDHILSRRRSSKSSAKRL